MGGEGAGEEDEIEDSEGEGGAAYEVSCFFRHFPPIFFFVNIFFSLLCQKFLKKGFFPLIFRFLRLFLISLSS